MLLIPCEAPERSFRPQNFENFIFPVPMITVSPPAFSSPSTVAFGGSSDGATLVASGTIMPLNKDKFSVSFQVGGNTLTLAVEIYTDETDPKPRWEAKSDPLDPKTITLKFANLNAPLGGGPDAPVPLWKSDISTILAQVRIWTADTNASFFHFSFYERRTTKS